MILWDRLAHTHLNHEAMDSVTWAWEKSGEYSVRSAYQARFMGREIIPTADFTWKSRAPLRCRFFAWIALQNRCWTSDRLARHGLDHQEACPFCDQHEESIDHILLHCVFARQVWSIICTAMNKPNWTPRQGSSLSDWCITTQDLGRRTKDGRAVYLRTMWELWKHRNAIVFHGASPSIRTIVHHIEDEGRAWSKVGRSEERRVGKECRN